VGVIFTVTSASPDGNGQGATLSLLVGAGFAPAGALASGGVSPSRAGAAALIMRVRAIRGRSSQVVLCED